MGSPRPCSGWTSSITPGRPRRWTGRLSEALNMPAASDSMPNRQPVRTPGDVRRVLATEIERVAADPDHTLRFISMQAAVSGLKSRWLEASAQVLLFALLGAGLLAKDVTLVAQ